MDVTQIFNMAIGDCGIKQTIASPTENSQHAIQCRRYYEGSRDMALAAYDWGCARRRVAPSLLAGAVPSVWVYKYQFPENCLMPRRFETLGTRTPSADARIPFEISSELISGQDTKVIYTDVAPAQAMLVYTHRLENPQLFDPHLTRAIAYLLATQICVPLTVKADLAGLAYNNYLKVIGLAATLNMNARQEDPEPQTGAIRARIG
jgi:hypothetical protein